MNGFLSCMTFCCRNKPFPAQNFVDTLAVNKILTNSKIHRKDLFHFFWLQGMLSFENHRLQATREHPQIVKVADKR